MEAESGKAEVGGTMDAGQGWYYKVLLCKFCESSAQRRVGGVGKWTVTATQAGEKSQWRHDKRPIHSLQGGCSSADNRLSSNVDKLIERPVRAGTLAPCGRCEPASLLAGGGHASNHFYCILPLVLVRERHQNHQSLISSPIVISALSILPASEACS